MGTSLKVLNAYKVLWPKKVKIVVMNLQWTQKNKKAALVINETRSCSVSTDVIYFIEYLRDQK